MFAEIDMASDMLIQTRDIVNTNRAEQIQPIEYANTITCCSTNFLTVYQPLAYTSEPQGETLWSMPSKFHWLWHAADRARHINPRKGPTWMDEDDVGLMKKLAHSCGPGSWPHQCIEKMMFIYR